LVFGAPLLTFHRCRWGHSGSSDRYAPQACAWFVSTDVDRAFRACHLIRRDAVSCFRLSCDLSSSVSFYRLCHAARFSRKGSHLRSAARYHPHQRVRSRGFSPPQRLLLRMTSLGLFHPSTSQDSVRFGPRCYPHRCGQPRCLLAPHTHPSKVCPR
jgi:hypothetical protein